MHNCYAAPGGQGPDVDATRPSPHLPHSTPQRDSLMAAAAINPGAKPLVAYVLLTKRPLRYCSPAYVCYHS
jgi:hypothetical protein